MATVTDADCCEGRLPSFPSDIVNKLVVQRTDAGRTPFILGRAYLKFFPAGPFAGSRDPIT